MPFSGLATSNSTKECCLHTANCPTCNKLITVIIIGSQRVLKAHDTDGRPLSRQRRASVCTGSGMVIPVNR